MDQAGFPSQQESAAGVSQHVNIGEGGANAQENIPDIINESPFVNMDQGSSKISLKTIAMMKSQAKRVRGYKCKLVPLSRQPTLEQLLLQGLEHRQRFILDSGEVVVEEIEQNSDDSLPSPMNDAHVAKQDSTISLPATQPEVLSRAELFCKNITTSKWFTRLTIAVVFMNVLVLSYENPSRESSGKAYTTFHAIDKICASFYLSEAVLKIISEGKVSFRNAYFDDKWNRFDFVVAILGISSFIPQLGANLAISKTVRAIKPLRFLTLIPGLRPITNSLILSLSKLFDLAVWMLMLTFLFAIAGTQLFSGKLSGRCFENGILVENDPLPCDLDRAYGRHCPASQDCIDTGVTPLNNILDFENVGRSYVSVLVIVFVQGWIPLVETLLHAQGAWVMIYVVAILLSITLLGINLTLAVLNSSFINAQDESSPFRQLLQTELLNHQDERTAAKLPIAEEQEISPWRTKCRNLVDSKTVRYGVMVAIITNTLVLSMEYHESPHEISETIRYANMVFTSIFAFELTIKLLGYGLGSLKKSRLLLLDFITTFLGILDIMISSKDNGLSSLQLLRIFKLAAVWPPFYKLLSTLGSSLESIALVTFLLIIFIYTYAVIGFQMFYGIFSEDSNPEDRSNFQTVYQGALTSFQVITGDSWADLMMTAIQEKGWGSSIFFITNILFGHYVILNLFLAVVLQFFALTAFKAKIEARRQKRLRMLKQKMKFALQAKKQRKKRLDSNSKNPDNTQQNMRQQVVCDGSETEGPKSATDTEHVGNISSEGIVNPTNPNFMSDVMDDAGENGEELELTPKCRTANLWMNNQGAFRSSLITFLDKSSLVDDPIPEAENSLHSWKTKAHRIFYSKTYQLTIYATIFVSAILLAVDNPNDPLSQDARWVWNFFEMLTIIIFVFEMVLKVSLYGFWKSQNAYLKSAWNRLDFLLIITSISTFSMEGHDLKSVNTLRLLRGLRPLRLMGQFEDLRIVIHALFQSIPDIMNLLLVILLFFVIFAVIAVRLFSGRFYSCNDGLVTHVSQCIGLFSDEQGLLSHRVWANSVNNFDNTIEGMLSWFQISTYDNWHTLMYMAVDVSDVGHQPVKNNNLAVTVLFLSFQLIVGFFLVNVFIAILIDTFNQIKEEMKGNALLTPFQREWVNAIILMMQLRPKVELRRPYGTISRLCHDFVAHPVSRKVSLLLTVYNVIIMALQHGGQSQIMTDFIYYNKVVLLAFYILEVTANIIAYSPRRFLRNSWSKFDLTILLIFLVEVIMMKNWPVILFRFVRLADRFQFSNSTRFRVLYRAVVTSLPSVFNIGCIIVLMMFIYSVIGMHLFGDVANGTFIGSAFNFRSFPNAIMTLSMIVSGDNWTEVVSDCLEDKFGCDEDDYGCYGAAIVYAYFMSFQFGVAFLLSNLFATVVIDSYSQSLTSEESAFQLMHCEKFQDAWATLDPDGIGRIKAPLLLDLMKAVGLPLGVPSDMPNEEIQQFILKLQIPVDNQMRVTFHFTLHALTERVVGADLPVCEMVDNLESRVASAYRVDQVQGVLSLEAIIPNKHIMKWLSRARDIRKRNSSARNSNQSSFRSDPKSSVHQIQSGLPSAIQIQSDTKPEESTLVNPRGDSNEKKSEETQLVLPHTVPNDDYEPASNPLATSEMIAPRQSPMLEASSPKRE